MPVTKWYGEKIVEAALDVEEKRMEKAGEVVVGNVKRLLNRGNPTGKNPSAPGEPPRKVTARLFMSITKKIIRTKTDITCWVGTNVKYAQRLEKGFVGKDSAGRTIDQKPRPFLVPGLANSMAAVKRILGAK